MVLRQLVEFKLETGPPEQDLLDEISWTGFAGQDFLHGICWMGSPRQDLLE